MAEALLGPSFDIHGGGIDLAFPHHENELAQSMCAHPDAGFANVWMHNGMLNIESEKMSKSLGNFFTVRDVLNRNTDGQVIRWVLLSTHYRSPLDWTEQRVAEATTKLTHWRTLKRRLKGIGLPTAFDPNAIDPEVLAALSDDLNTSDALNRRISELMARAQLGSSDASRAAFSTLEFLGFDLERLFEEAIRRSVGRAFDLTERVRVLLERRQQAREKRDFHQADAIRDKLIAAGIKVMDRAGAETEWELGPNFDASKLAAIEP
jgi:cysteinyl-tRNA synthetase